MNFLQKIWSVYTKNTFVRHLVVAAISISVLEYSDFLTQGVAQWFHTAPVQIVLGGVIAVAVRWAQTNLELLVIQLNVPKE